jgi:hypothetical protein
MTISAVVRGVTPGPAMTLGNMRALGVEAGRCSTIRRVATPMGVLVT